MTTRILAVLMTAAMSLSCGVYSLGYGGGCFIGGTMVQTPSGERPIEDVKVGDEVLTLDLETAQLVAGVVDDVRSREVREYLRLSLANGATLGVTAEHPLYHAKAKQFVPAGEFRAGESLGAIGVRRDVLIDAEITGMSSLTVDKPIFVYNLRVRRYESAFIGGVLAHFY